MNLKLNEKVILVIGASVELVEAVVTQLAMEGAYFVLASPDEQANAEILEKCMATGGYGITCTINFNEKSTFEQIAKEILGRFGRVDGMALIHDFKEKVLIENNFEDLVAQATEDLNSTDWCEEYISPLFSKTDIPMVHLIQGDNNQSRVETLRNHTKDKVRRGNIICIRNKQSNDSAVGLAVFLLSKRSQSVINQVIEA